MGSTRALLLLGAIVATLSVTHATSGRGLLQAGADVTYSVDSPHAALCMKSGLPGLINYVGSECGDGKILWQSMATRASDEVAGFTCAWNRNAPGNPQQEWIDSWVGTSCGVKPTMLPRLPTHMYTIKIYKPRVTTGSCPDDKHHLKIAEIYVRNAAGTQLILDYCGNSPACASGLVDTGLSTSHTPLRMIDGTPMTAGISSASNYCSEDHWVEFGIRMTEMEAASVAIVSVDQTQAALLQGSIVTITGPNKEQWAWTIEGDPVPSNGAYGYVNDAIRLATYRNLASDGTQVATHELGPGSWGNPLRTGHDIRPNAVVDGVDMKEAWLISPTSLSPLQMSDCATPYYVTVNLGSAILLDHLTAWSYGDGRSHCGTKFEVSPTGEFAGEETVVYEGTGADKWGPEMTAAGHTIHAPAPGVVVQYIRWWQGKNSKSGYPFFVELGVWGDAPPPPPPSPPPFNGASVVAGGCRGCALTLACEESTPPAGASTCARAVDGADETDFVAASAGLNTFVRVRPSLPMRVTGVAIADRPSPATAIKDVEVTFLPNGEVRTVSLKYIAPDAPNNVAGGNGMIAQRMAIDPPVAYAETVRFTITSEYGAGGAAHGFTDIQLEGEAVPAATSTRKSRRLLRG